jgi:hypothetical protein
MRFTVLEKYYFIEFNRVALYYHFLLIEFYLNLYAKAVLAIQRFTSSHS